jgi:hypothetical protein
MSMDEHSRSDFKQYTLTLQKLRMLQIRGVKGEAVVNYREPLTTKEIRYPRLSQPAPPELQRRREGRKHDKLKGLTWNSYLVISKKNLELRQDLCY